MGKRTDKTIATANEVKAALAIPGTYPDSDVPGLFLKVRASKDGGAGSAQWFVRIQRDGNRQDIGLGSGKLVSLSDARKKARDTRNAVKVEGRDVLAESKNDKAAKVTFRDAAKQYHAEMKRAGKAKPMPANGLLLSKTMPFQSWATKRQAQ